jgi:RNA-binding protein
VGRRVLRGQEAVRAGTEGLGAPASGGSAIVTLSSKQRAHLRALAHPLKPVAQVGGEGITDSFIGSLGDAFNTRELLKVRVLENAPLDARAAATQIAARLPGVQIPQVIGRTIVLYKASEDDPQIHLPA